MTRAWASAPVLALAQAWAWAWAGAWAWAWAEAYGTTMEQLWNNYGTTYGTTYGTIVTCNDFRHLRDFQEDPELLPPPPSAVGVQNSYEK